FSTKSPSSQKSPASFSPSRNASMLELPGRAHRALKWRNRGVILAGLSIAAVMGWTVIGDFLLSSPSETRRMPPAREASAWDAYPESGTPMPEVSAATEPAPQYETGTSSPFVYETSVRLEKGDTLGSALHDLGFEARDIGEAIEALAEHVNLKRLPV